MKLENYDYNHCLVRNAVSEMARFAAVTMLEINSKSRSRNIAGVCVTVIDLDKSVHVRVGGSTLVFDKHQIQNEPDFFLTTLEHKIGNAVKKMMETKYES